MPLGPTTLLPSVVLHLLRSVLATARALDPSAHLRNLPTNDSASIAKMVVSLAQIVAATPLVLVARHFGQLRSFLEGLNMINLSIPKVRKVGVFNTLLRKRNGRILQQARIIC